VKLGNHRYVQHLKDDAELEAAIGDAQEETDKEMNDMASEFNAALANVRAELAKDRKHAEDTLSAGTAAVWKTLNANQKLQEEKNAAMAAATRRMKLDAMDAVREAKAEFTKKIKDLSEVVATNDQAADKKIKDLTGVVDDEAVKSRKGREEIAALEKANKDELKASIEKAIADGEKRAKEVEANGEKMDADAKWLVENKLKTEISKLRDATNGSVEALALLGKEARLAMRKEMLYAIRSAADVAQRDLEVYIRDAGQKMVAFQKKADESHAASEEARGVIADEVATNAAQVTKNIDAAVATQAAAQATLKQQTHAKIKETNTQIDAYSAQMALIAEQTRADIKTLETETLEKIKTEAERAADATSEFADADAARQKAALEFLETSLAAAAEASELKFGAAYKKIADNRAAADLALSSATTGLNDALAKQAALADSRFQDTVDDIAVARKEAADEVAGFRAQYAVQLAATTSSVKLVETKLNNMVSKVSGEVADMKAAQYRINGAVNTEIERIEKLSNDRFTESKKARGKLRLLMDENKQAAADEVGALRTTLEDDISKLRAKNANAKVAMAKDLTDATETFYEALAAQVKDHTAATDATNTATVAAADISRSKLDHAEKAFDSKIVQLTNTVTANAKHAKDGLDHITGVVSDYASEAESDRELIRAETLIMHNDLDKALSRAISEGEAKAKAVEQRIAAHLKTTTSFLQVELIQQVEEAADSVLEIVEGKRQNIADNYLSLKAYAVSAQDDLDEYQSAGNGAGLSSVGALLSGIAMMEAVPAEAATGLGDGSTSIPHIFSGSEPIAVSGSVAAINGLVNEYTEQIGQTRDMYPLGLGKYLLDKAEESMMDKGVLMVDKVEGKHGNFVFINGHSVGLSNKLQDFAQLAANMNQYESVLAKLTADITATPNLPKEEGEVNPVHSTSFANHADHNNAWVGN